MSYKLAVVGSRTFHNYKLFESFMFQYPLPAVIVSGGAAGADSIGSRFAEKNNIPIEIYRPDWEKYGRSAGFKRNVEIIDNCDCVVAAWDSVSKGTVHSINLALNKNKPVKIIYFGYSNNKDDRQEIKGFQEQHRWLSNFWPTEIQLGSLTFNSSESAYQASKFMDNIELMKKFQKMTPLDAKRAAKEYQICSKWYDKKLQFMRMVVLAKFEQNPYLAKKLKNTGNAYLEESNSWYDVFWGVCEGEGENWLGKILMEVRSKI